MSQDLQLTRRQIFNELTKIVESKLEYQSWNWN